MKTGTKRCLVLPLAVLGLWLGVVDRAMAVDHRLDSLDNGMKLILVENHNSPVIASVILVDAGSKCESEYECGVARLLANLLWEGAALPHDSEPGSSIYDLGGQAEAFTSEELAGYSVLLPKAYIEYGLTVQANLLFFSTITDEKLADSRLAAIAEITTALQVPGAPARAFFKEKAHGNADYGRPVLGYEEVVANIPREAVIDFWKKHYTPGKMTVLLIGDFDTKAMKKMVASVFDRIPRTEEPDEMAASNLHRRLAGAKARSGQIVGQHRYDTVADVTSGYVNFSIAAPDYESPDYLPFDLLTHYLDLDGVSPLKTTLQGGADAAATDVLVTLSTYAEFSRLEIAVVTDQPKECDSIVRHTLAKLAEMSSHTPDPTIIGSIKTFVRCDAAYDSEEIQHYGIQIAPMLMTAGWEWTESYPDRLDSVTTGQYREVADRWLRDPDYIVTVVRPADSTETPYRAGEPSAEQVSAYFGVAEFPAYDLTADTGLVYPTYDSIRLETSDDALYRREVLDNGLTVLVESNPDRSVFAAGLLGRNRSANEPQGKAGITEFVNRCLEKRAALSNLAAVGARLRVKENPEAGDDDLFGDHRFACVSFETIDRYAPEGFDLLVDILTRPGFESTAVEAVRAEMLAILDGEAESPSKVAGKLFHETLFEGHPFARPIKGRPESIASITVDELWAHHKCFYSPQNTILSIVTSRDTAEVMGWVRSTLGGMTNLCDPADSPESPATKFAASEVHRPLDTALIAIVAGGRLPGAASDEALDIRVAIEILVQRLTSIVRHRQGIASSAYAKPMFDASFGWYTLSIETDSGNYMRALEGLKLQTEKLAFDGPTPTEVRGAVNRLWGRMMNDRLSRSKQAFGIGLDEFHGRDVPSDSLLVRRLEAVDAVSVRRVAARYFRPETWVIATSGKSE